jgi:hypothetical protein
MMHGCAGVLQFDSTCSDCTALDKAKGWISIDSSQCDLSSLATGIYPAECMLTISSTRGADMLLRQLNKHMSLCIRHAAREIGVICDQLTKLLSTRVLIQYGMHMS